MLNVTAAIIEQESRIMLARRRRDLKYGGKWEFPGGKIEPHESPEHCLAREMKEEFDITVAVGDAFTENQHRYDDQQVHITAFWVKWIAGELVPTDHDTIAWVSPEELLTYDLIPADIPIARKLRAELIAGK